MANKILFFMALVALGIPSGIASAQDQLDLPAFEAPEDPPPPLAIPDDSSSSEDETTIQTDDLPIPDDSSTGEFVEPLEPLEPFAAPVSSGDLQGSAEYFALDEDAHLFDCEPARLESTGTWLRRGFWYTEVDVVISDRIWRRDDMVLMSQFVGRAQGALGQTVFINNYLLIDGGQSGAEAVPRLKLGRFLFRDSQNRDHAVEFIAYGGGQWSQNGRLDANPLNSENTTSLFVPADPGRGNVSFTGATSSQFDYNSRLNSFELNYHVSSRMRKDRMELEPSGHWIRRAQPSVTKSLIAGIRYFDLSEDILWGAFGIPDADNDGNLEEGVYSALTDNDLIGTQLGFSVSHERARWSLGARVKGGIFLNHADSRSAFAVTGNLTSGNNQIVDDNLSFLTDAELIAKWHLRPNLSIRVGLEGMFLTSLAFAPDQLNFVPVGTSENTAQGDQIFLGGLIGLESYW